MLRLFVAILSVSIIGCASLVIEEPLDGINEIDDEYGYLILNLDSNWRDPNENPFLGRPMDMSFSTRGQLLKSVLFTKPETRKIVRLKPADYDVSFTLVDVNFFFVEAVRIPIRAGTVTNLGTVFLEVPYDDRGRTGWRISSISQSGFDALERDVATDSAADFGEPLRFRFFDSSRRFGMRNSLGDLFPSDYKVEE